MKIAVIGQSLFGQEVYKELRKSSHTIVGVFTIPDKDGKADPLGRLSMVTKREVSQCSGPMMGWTQDQSCSRESVMLNQMTLSAQSTRDFSSQRESKAW
uniref:Uncharacterized protein n=1 Tax=Kryptolebias marmoratus TaxID=37003 RepID=A0A3Q3AIY6_KRYMA